MAPQRELTRAVLDRRSGKFRRPRCHELAEESSTQGILRTLEIHVGGWGRSQALFGALLRRACASHVNFFGALGALCQNDDAICQHLGESPHYGGVRSLSALQVTQFPNAEFGQQGRVTWKDAKLPAQARELDGLNRIAQHLAIRGDQFESNRLG